MFLAAQVSAHYNYQLLYESMSVNITNDIEYLKYYHTSFEFSKRDRRFVWSIHIQ